MSSEVKEEEKKTKPCCMKNKDKKLTKISDLPLYGNPYPKCDRIQNEELGYIESGVKTVREEVSPYLSVLGNGSQRAKEILTTAYEHSKSTYGYISSEGNTVPKAIAITGGGLLGLLISSRKGFFKKIFYISAGLTAASSACYPQEAQELAQIGFFILKTKGPEIIKEYIGIDLKRKTGSKESPNPEPKNSEPIKPDSPQNQSSTTSAVKPTAPEGKGDYGMSKKEDKDLYANRSTK